VKAPRTARWMRCFPYVFIRLSPSEMIFKAQATSKRKDNSPQATLPWTHRRQLLCSLSSPQTGFGILAEFPFPQCQCNQKQAPGARPFQGGFPRGLGPTYPCPSTVHMETYSASVFCVLNRIIATTTKICTRYTIARRLTPDASARAPRPPTRLWLKTTSQPAYHRRSA
jgi:hypothetical protein